MLDAIIVDDYSDHADLMEYLLNVLGVKVLAKGQNGMDALRLYKIHDPDFVFLDVSMPVYDGLFALDRTRRQNPLVPIIMVTADTSERTKRQLSFLGATAILYKPVDRCRLSDIVQNEWRETLNIKSAQCLLNPGMVGKDLRYISKPYTVH